MSRDRSRHADGRHTCRAARSITSSGRVEVVLANEHHKDLEEIRKEFAEAGLTNLHVQFMKAGKPPTNIGLGPSVTAGRARAAIRMAKKYNRDVTILLPERRRSWQGRRK